MSMLHHRAQRIAVRCQSTLHAPRPTDPESGQATTEYALVLLGAALVALLVVAWASGGGASGKVGQLFDRVIESVAGRL